MSNGPERSETQYLTKAIVTQPIYRGRSDIKRGKECLTYGTEGVAYIYHLRSNSGSNGPIAKESHRFLVAGPFKCFGWITKGCTRRTTDSGTSTSSSTKPSL